ncbi:MAG: Unknown protein [uncultured Campylobacterales bacterium]|uniref:OmpA-like domain-containing protein n=1 Tax=uncultured Campylobacterales bacterium TaxID=352960 RepID=A0A6S6RV17_9BACT|nr:MAG: Unknown protein [uncultured Campylobacterales bacterium]
MKKIFTIILLSATLFSSNTPKYEFGFGFGINSLIEHFNFDTPSFQFTIKRKTESRFSPRFDIDYLLVDIDGYEASSLMRLSANLLYDFDFNGTELSLLGGLGYEILDEETDGFENQLVLAAGILIEQPITNRFSLRGEYKAIQVLSSDFDENMEHQFIFGFKLTNNNIKRKVRKVQKVQKVQPIIKRATTLEQRKIDYIRFVKNNCLIENFPEKYIPEFNKNKNCLLITKLNPYAESYIKNIKELSNFLNKYQTLEVYLEDHTSYANIRSKRLPLQNNKFEKVKTDLIKFGINKNQIKLNDYGTYHLNKEEKTNYDEVTVIIRPSESHLKGQTK